MNLSIQKDLIYADQGRPLRWDIYKPGDVTPGAPVVLVLHGGGWRAGERGMMAAACTAYAVRGYVAIAPEYRLLGEAAWPAPLDDVKAAVIAARAQADALGVSREHVFLTGFSAGAHLSLLAASHLGDAAAGVAAFFPPARIDARRGLMFGLQDPLDLAAVSPIEHSAKLPPTIVFCGDADPITPWDGSLELYRAIRSVGGTADLRLFSNLIHEYVQLPGMMDISVESAIEFFNRTVINKISFDSALVDLQRWWQQLMPAFDHKT